MVDRLRIINGGRGELRCEQCSLRPICLPDSLAEDFVDALGAIIRAQPPVSKAHTIYRQGDRCDTVFAVRAGSAKNVIVSTDGIETVTAFHFPGDIIGLESLGQGDYASSAMTLERSSLCAIAIDELEQLCAGRGLMVHRMFEEIGKELASSEHARARILRHDADARLVDFLLETSQRLENARRSPTVLNLSMSRRDIGSYIGLAAETVSRSFTRLEALGLLRVEGKCLQILDRNGLRALLSSAPSGSFGTP